MAGALRHLWQSLSQPGPAERSFAAHGMDGEYDIRTGESWFDPLHTKVRHYKTEIVHGSELVKGPYRLDLVAVDVDDEYLMVTF